MFSVKPSVRQGSLWNTFIPDFLLLKAADTQASPVFQHPPAWQEFCPGFELLLSFAYTLCKWIMIPVSKMPYQSLGLDTPGQSLLMTVASECSKGAAQTPAVWVGQAQGWREWKFLLSFSTPALCKELHTSGKILLCTCTNENQESSLCFSLPLGKHPATASPHQAWELPLPRASWHGHLLFTPTETKRIQLNKYHWSPQTYFLLVCFLVLFSPDLWSNTWAEGRLLWAEQYPLFPTGCGGSMCLSSPLPPLQCPVLSVLSLLTSVQ